MVTIQRKGALEKTSRKKVSSHPWKKALKKANQSLALRPLKRRTQSTPVSHRQKNSLKASKKSEIQALIVVLEESLETQ